jgi:hypothetical protein
MRSKESYSPEAEDRAFGRKETRKASWPEERKTLLTFDPVRAALEGIMSCEAKAIFSIIASDLGRAALPRLKRSRFETKLARAHSIEEGQRKAE